MYIKTPEGEWVVLGAVSNEGVTFVPQPEVEIVSPPWWGAGVAIEEPKTISFEMKFAKFNQEDFVMLVFMVSRKEARRILGTKPLLKKGKAWR